MKLLNIKNRKIMLEKNVPYVKQYDKDGLLLNPIVKPYLSLNPIRSQRRLKTKMFSSNRIAPIFYGAGGYWEKLRNKFFTGKVVVNPNKN